MYCPKCQHPRRAGQTECDSCGIVFAKYEAMLERERIRSDVLGESEAVDDESVAEPLSWREALLTPSPDMHRYFWPYALLWAVFLVWNWGFITESLATYPDNTSFINGVDLVFHEAGHVIFGVLGQFIGSLGGTLGQLAVPIVCGGVLFYQRRDTFGLSLCVWWVGQNFLRIGPYMADARAGEMRLIGGNYGKSSPYGFHDWEYLLTETGLIEHDVFLGHLVFNLGRLIMVAALVWAGVLLWRAYKQQETDI